MCVCGPYKQSWEGSTSGEEQEAECWPPCLGPCSLCQDALLFAKRNSVDVIILRILSWGGDAGLSGWPLSEIPSAFPRGTQDRISLRRRQGEDMEQVWSRGWSDVAASEGMPVAPQSWKRVRIGSHQEPPRRGQLCWNLDFNHTWLIWTSGCQNC